MQDKNTGQTWSVSVVDPSSFNSAYEAMKEGFRYALLVQQKEITHWQDPYLDNLFRLSFEERARALSEIFEGSAHIDEWLRKSR